MPSEVPTKDKPSKDKNYLELHDPAVHESKRWTIDSAGNKENLIPPKGQRSTFRIDPPSNLLSRLADFLPKLKQANQELESKIESGESLDIETVDEDQQHIEMNLDLGVFDIQTPSSAEEELKLKKEGIKLSVDDCAREKEDVGIEELEDLETSDDSEESD